MTTIPPVPEGQRFDHVYIDRGEPVSDSNRMRVRLRSLVASDSSLYQSTILEHELGLDFPNWHAFFEKAKVRDVLAFVTIAYRTLARESYVGETKAGRWLGDVQRILSEENLHYRVDRKGGVHFSFDREFEHVTAAAISILRRQRYANSLDAFNKCMLALSEAPPDGKGAIRAAFAALEGLFGLMFPGVHRLAAGEVSQLRPLVERTYSGDRRAQEASIEMLDSLRDWIDAAHQYRHEEGKPDTVAQPPLTLAVYLVSAGASHLRWIAELDAATAH